MDQLSLILFDLLIDVAYLAIQLHTLCWLTSSGFQSQSLTAGEDGFSKQVSIAVNTVVVFAMQYFRKCFI